MFGTLLALKQRIILSGLGKLEKSFFLSMIELLAKTDENITVSSREDIQNYEVKEGEIFFIIENDPDSGGNAGRYSKTSDGKIWWWAAQVTEV